LSALETLADVDEPIADIAAAQLADGRTLVTWVTHTIGYVTGEETPATATLAFRFVDNGQLGPVHTLSERAISTGGVDVVALPADSKAGVAIIGWAGPANGSQVYASLIDRNGGKAQQKTVTKIVRQRSKTGAPNEVYDVDVTPDSHGHYLFAWSDSRDGNPEVYVARVTDRLQKNKNDTRITTTSGASSEPQLITLGERVLVAWSDSEDGPLADIYVAELDGNNVTLNGKPRRLDESPAHSRTPHWTGQAGALGLSWIDEATDDEPATGRLVALDDRGDTATAARRIRVSTSAAVTSLFATCDKDGCRGVVGASHGPLLHFAPFETARSSGAPIVATVTSELAGASQQDLSMVSDGSDGVFFIHDRTGGARIRRLSVHW
jgi:hypothetical protein